MLVDAAGDVGGVHPESGESVGNDTSEADGWQREFHHLNAEQLDDLAEEVVRELYVASKDAFEIRFEGGHYDVLGTGNKWNGAGWDEKLVMQVRQPPEPGGEIRRVILSGAEFPDYYLLKRKILWARTRAQFLRAQLAASKTK